MAILFCLAKLTFIFDLGSFDFLPMLAVVVVYNGRKDGRVRMRGALEGFS